MCFDNGALISFQDVVMLEKLCGIKGNEWHREAQDGMLTGANLGDVMFIASTVGSDGATDWTGIRWAWH